ncbi:MAG: hypothetical protein ACAF41_14040 [Leptolyngbya sp. BL-A-14]
MQNNIDREEPIHLDPEAAQAFLEALPKTIRESIERRAEEINFPTWAILEMLIAQGLDDDATSFIDCIPMY